MERFDITWLDPIKLELSGNEDQAALVKRLQRKIADDASVDRLDRSVYIIRMAGSFIIDYPDGASPVVYIGRGDSVSRLARHLKRWATDVFKWGSDSNLEVRILRPARTGRYDYFANVEADLLRMFYQRYGGLPMMNKRFEDSYAGVVDYGKTQQDKLWASIGIGKGVRYKWAIRPLRSNKHYATYHAGQD
ncbi:hypothetical protein [Sphingomonas olei]|uniref:GIY-YIG domain-containing protein n=1 Tax=Sphingomonas olei TaxID=1886787 RepID=A0ABY2QEH0_9SPHN|nr:hypothetical protein [Sphingomonas olei]THG37785.1 hypothetical protein E5988_15660 [Sphingomonas olei]